MAPTTTEIDPKRSARMRLIRAKDTKPEWRVRRALHRAGLRYRLHARELTGRPDIVFRRLRIAIYVHGCFWHQHPEPTCKRARTPKSRQDFWLPKLAANRARDERAKASLEADGWRVIEMWECALDDARLAELVRLIQEARGDRALETAMRRG